MKRAVLLAPSLAVAVGMSMLLLASGCAGGSVGVAGRQAADTVEASRSTGAVPSVEVAPTGLTTVQPSGSIAPALAQASSELKRYPSATVQTGSASGTVYSIIDARVSGSVRYVDAYSVVYVCGAGVPDDCQDSIGAPELRIPIAPNAAFHILGTDMRPDKTTDFAGFRAYAAGPDGTYDGSNTLFEVTLGSGEQATSFTAVYTP